MEKASNGVTFNLLQQGREYAETILKGLKASTSHFHGVQYMKDLLAGNDFTEIKEIDAWNLVPGKAYFFTRNQSTIIAFVMGDKCAEGPSVYKIIGCHTDSPVIKLAPSNKAENKSGSQQLNV